MRTDNMTEYPVYTIRRVGRSSENTLPDFIMYIALNESAMSMILCGKMLLARVHTQNAGSSDAEHSAQLCNQWAIWIFRQ